jgi:hypothetical protein
VGAMWEEWGHVGAMWEEWGHVGPMWEEWGHVGPCGRGPAEVLLWGSLCTQLPWVGKGVVLYLQVCVERGGAVWHGGQGCVRILCGVFSPVFRHTRMWGRGGGLTRGWCFTCRCVLTEACGVSGFAGGSVAGCEHKHMDKHYHNLLRLLSSSHYSVLVCNNNCRPSFQ